MGLEVSGNYEIFKDSILSKGFKYINSFESLHRFYGKFANEIVTLNILTSPITKTVCKVIVLFPEKKDWRELKKDYLLRRKCISQNIP